MQEYNWAQDKLNELTGTDQKERHKAQLQEVENEYRQGMNRAQRREIERQERRMAKKVVRA